MRRETATISGGNLMPALKNRQAKPLTGLEVKDSIKNHLLTLTGKLLDESGLLSDAIVSLTEQLDEAMDIEFRKHTLLQKVNVAYPKVGWNVKTRLEISEMEVYSVNAEVELDLQYNHRINIRFGESGLGKVVRSMEEEKITNPVPDRDREKFGLKVEAEFLRPDGTTGKIDVTELRRQRRAAKTIDVGSGADNRLPIQVPTDENGIIETREILAGGGEIGNEIVLPSELPEISLDTQKDGYMYNGEDLVATPPEIPKEPPAVPLPPPGGMNRVARPRVAIK